MCAVAVGGQERGQRGARAAMRQVVCALLYNEEWVSVGMVSPLLSQRKDPQALQEVPVINTAKLTLVWASSGDAS